MGEENAMRPTLKQMKSEKTAAQKQGKASRAKGAAGELEVAKLFKAHGYAEARRGYQRRSGAEAPDVDCTPYWLEVKRGKSHPSITGALKQASNDNDGRPPVVFSRGDKEQWLVSEPGFPPIDVDWLRYKYRSAKQAKPHTWIEGGRTIVITVGEDGYWSTDSDTWFALRRAGFVQVAANDNGGG